MATIRPGRCLLAALTVALATSAGAAGSAGAHAGLERAEPAPDSTIAAPPDRVDLWFSSPLEPGSSANQISVNGPSGQAVHRGTATLDPDDPSHLSVPIDGDGPGIYQVEWQSVSAEDGDVLSGSFQFSVRPGSSSERNVDWPLLGGLGLAALLIAASVGVAIVSLNRVEGG